MDCDNLILSPIKLFCHNTIELIEGSKITTLTNFNIMKDIYKFMLLYTKDKINDIIAGFLCNHILIYPVNEDEILIIYEETICLYRLSDREIVRHFYHREVNDHIFYKNKYLLIHYVDGFDMFEIDKLEYKFYTIYLDLDIKIIPHYDYYKIIEIKDKIYILIGIDDYITIYEYNSGNVKEVDIIHTGDAIKEYHIFNIKDKLFIVVNTINIVYDVDKLQIESKINIPVYDRISVINDVMYFIGIYIFRQHITVDNLEYINDSGILKGGNVVSNISAEVWRFTTTGNHKIVDFVLLSPSTILILDEEAIIEIYDMKDNSHMSISVSYPLVKVMVLSYNQFIYNNILYTVNYNDKSVQETMMNIDKPLFTLKTTDKSIKGLIIPILSTNIKNIILKYI